MTSATDQRRQRWRSLCSLTGPHRPPAALRQCLQHEGSLTRSLHKLLGSALGLRLQGQGWRTPTANEARLLGVSPRHRCLERRVSLMNGIEPVVLARSLMPVSSLRGRNRRLANLGSRPLGEALFADRSVQRRVLELAWLQAGHPLFPDLSEATWARRSVFVLARRPLLVYEAFLPCLVEALTGQAP